MPTTSTLRSRPRRKVWYVDEAGIDTRVKHSESIVTETFDFTDELASGEYIFSATWTTSGVTLTNKTSATVASLAAALQAGSASGTYYYRIAVVDSDGNAVAWSDEVTSSPSAQDVVLTWTAWTGTPALGSYRVWKGTTSNTYTEYFAIAAGTETYTDDDTAGTSGTPAYPVTFSATVDGVGTATVVVVTSDSNEIKRKYRWLATDDYTEDYT